MVGRACGTLEPMPSCAVKRTLLVTLLTNLLTLAGCASQTTIVTAPVEIDSREYARVFDASVLVLRELGYRVDRQDYRFGRVTTWPKGTATAAEIWRHEELTPYQSLEATLNSQRRSIIVMLDPIDASPDPDASTTLTGRPLTPLPGSPTSTLGAQAYRLRVEVLIEEQQRPTEYLNGSTTGQRMNSNLREVPIELASRGIAATYWQPTGRDPYMESRIVAQIIRKSVELPDTRSDALPSAESDTTPGTPGSPSTQPGSPGSPGSSDVPAPGAVKGLEGY
jgi:hypothetical protein